MIRFLGRWAYNILVAIDQLVNALLWGDPDETLSARVGRIDRGDWGPTMVTVIQPVRVAFDFFWWPLDRQWNHCRRSIAADEGKDDLFGPPPGAAL